MRAEPQAARRICFRVVFCSPEKPSPALLWQKSVDYRCHWSGWIVFDRTLAAKGYEVHGIVRRASTFNRGRLDEVWSDPQLADTRLFLHYGDLGDSGSLTRLLLNVHPDEIYNWARKAMSVSASIVPNTRWM